ncbi:MAG: hypothetical protein J5959_06350, partial [Butyrivibrio sp.]|nr:hypothetical protein [Butyrivibrio sp.]
VEVDTASKTEKAITDVTAKVEGSQTDVGESPNKVMSITIGGYPYDVVWADDGSYSIDQEEYDDVKVVNGKLTVTPIEIHVKALNDSKIYGFDDPESFDVEAHEGSLTGPVFDLEKLEKIAKYEVEREAGENVRDAKDEADKIYEVAFKNCELLNTNYTVFYHPGEFVINPRPVKLLSGSKLNQPFTGKPITCEEVSAVVEDEYLPFVGDENVYVKMDPESYVIYPGEGQPNGKDNKFTVTGPQKGTRLSNYVITEEYGKLSVEKREGDKKIKIVIKVDSGVDGQNYKELVYNGERQYLPVVLNVDGNAYSTTEEEEGSSSIIDDFKELIESWKKGLKDFLVITANASEGREIKKTLTVDGVTFTISGVFVKDAEGLDVNEYPIMLDTTNMSITVNEIPVDDEFDVEVELLDGTVTNEKGVSQIGKLVIKKRPVTLISESASKQYDGTPLTRPDVTEVGKGEAERGFVKGEATDIIATGSITNPGETVNSIVFTPAGNFKESNYIINIQEGTLTVYDTEGDNPPPDDNPPSDNPPSDNPPSENPPSNPPSVLGAVRNPEVLGATREQAAVLGARRGNTSDDTNTFGRIIAIIVAAGVGFTMIFMKKKKEED